MHLKSFFSGRIFKILTVGVFNISNKVLVTLDLLITMREHISKGEPPGNSAEAVVKSLLALPDAPKVKSDEARYIVQKLYDGYYAFECIAERNWNDAICGICGNCPVFEGADGNCKNCSPISLQKVIRTSSYIKSLFL